MKKKKREGAKHFNRCERERDRESMCYLQEERKQDSGGGDLGLQTQIMTLESLGLA